MYLSLTTLDNDELLLGRGPGKNDFSVVLQNLIDLILRHVLKFCAMDHTGFGIPEKHT